MNIKICYWTLSSHRGIIDRAGQPGLQLSLGKKERNDRGTYIHVCCIYFIASNNFIRHLSWFDFIILGCHNSKQSFTANVSAEKDRWGTPIFSVFLTVGCFCLQAAICLPYSIHSIIHVWFGSMIIVDIFY